MTRYVAIINTPGYMPWSDEPPPVFDNASDAWSYLADERREAEDSAAMTEDNPSDGYSDTVAELEASSGTDTVYGPTPGHEGEHDLGVAYSVAFAEDDDDEENEGS